MIDGFGPVPGDPESVLEADFQKYTPPVDVQQFSAINGVTAVVKISKSSVYGDEIAAHAVENVKGPTQFEVSGPPQSALT